MKKLNVTQLEEIQGGNFMDGFCAVVGTAGTIAVFAGVITGGVSTVIAGAASGACAAYAWSLL